MIPFHRFSIRRFVRFRIETYSHQRHLAAALAAGCLAAACASAEHPPAHAVRARYLMGTTCTITVPEASAAATQPAFTEIERIEALLSTWRDDTELAALNAADGRPTTISPELFAVLGETFRWAERTGGAFNPLIRPLIDAWATREEGRVPAAPLLEDALRRTRLELTELDPSAHQVTLHGGATIEEGGFGKGYALDRALRVLRDEGTPYALIDFGGQVSLYGFDTGGEVAVAHPEKRDRPAVSLTLSEGSVATSSGSEKSFAVDGRLFSHLLDPRSGAALPPRGSVTVVDPSGLAADALSTALYVLGPAEGLRWADANGVAALYLVPAAQNSSRWEVRTSRHFPTRVRALRIISPNFAHKD